MNVTPLVPSGVAVKVFVRLERRPVHQTRVLNPTTCPRNRAPAASGTPVAGRPVQDNHAAPAAMPRAMTATNPIENLSHNGRRCPVQPAGRGRAEPPSGHPNRFWPAPILPLRQASGLKG